MLNVNSACQHTGGQLSSLCLGFSSKDFDPKERKRNRMTKLTAHCLANKSFEGQGAVRVVLSGVRGKDRGTIHRGTVVADALNSHWVQSSPPKPRTIWTVSVFSTGGREWTVLVYLRLLWNGSEQVLGMLSRSSPGSDGLPHGA